MKKNQTNLDPQEVAKNPTKKKVIVVAEVPNPDEDIHIISYAYGNTGPVIALSKDKEQIASRHGAMKINIDPEAA